MSEKVIFTSEEKENMMQEKVETLKIKGKANTRIYPLTEGLSEGNINQMPFISEYKGKRLTSVEYIWFQNTNGKIIKRGVEVSGHGTYGVPTLRDGEVLSCLQNIFIAKKTKNGRLDLKTENITEDDLKIEFTIEELAREMGSKNPNKLIRDNLKKSIEILVATTLFNRYEGGLYDIKTKEYIKDPFMMIHYLETCQGYQTIDGENKIIDVTQIKLSKFFYDSIANNYKLIYKKDKVQRTKNLIARKVYKMALQWSGDNNFAWATIDKLIEKVPINQENYRYKKQYIRNALEILNEKDMCKVVYDTNNENKVYFLFDEKIDMDNINEKQYMLDKFNTYKETRTELINIGFKEEEVDEYLDKNIQKIKLIQAILRYMNVREQYEKISDKKKFYNSYFDNKYIIDKEYFTKD